MLPASAKHLRLVLAAEAATIRAGRRSWRRVSPDDISGSWSRSLTNLEPVVAAAQLKVATSATDVAATDLAAQGIYRAPSAFVNPSAFAGFAPDGRDLAGLLYSPATTAKTLIANGAEPPAALRSAGKALDRILKTVVADTARQSGSVDIATRPGTGYVRVVVGNTCKDCVILAGKFYRWNAGFKRHPGCDCIHQATTEALSPGAITDPLEHFNSLTEAEQNELWGEGEAQAIRDGGDIYRVYNSGRGHKGMTTLEGTGKRGFARGIEGGRLTPDGIYATAKNREEALALLERHGYILPGGQVPGGSIRGRYYEGYGALGRGGTRVGAREAVLEARRTGVRTRSRATMTGAERRLSDATLRWDAVREGRNPYSSKPLTPEIAARVEKDYRRWLRTGGQVF